MTEQLSITGEVLRVFPLQSGTGSKGPWSKQDILLQTTGQFPKKIIFTGLNKTVERIGKVKIGENVKVSFSLESREYNDKWYTQAVIWRIEAGEVKKEQPKAEAEKEESEDDLPF